MYQLYETKIYKYAHIHIVFVDLVTVTNEMMQEVNTEEQEVTTKVDQTKITDELQEAAQTNVIHGKM